MWTNLYHSKKVGVNSTNSIRCRITLYCVLQMKKQKAKQNKIQTKKRSFFWGKFVLSQLVVSGLNGKKNVQQTFVYLKLKSANFTLLQMVWRIFFERYTYTCNCEQVILYAGKYSPRFIFAPFCPRCRCANWTLGEFHCLKLCLF